MLYDRDYMRDPDAVDRHATKKLIIILIVCFVLQSCFAFYGDVFLDRHLALSIEGLSKWKLWQLFSFQFLHSVPWPFHVLFNCLGLYFFGRSVEDTQGTSRFLKIYFSCGVLGGLFHCLSILVLPKHMDIPVVGASAGVYGVMAAFCTLFPMRELTTFIYFFPVNIRAIYLLWFLGLFALYGTIIPFDHVAHGAHLGGLLVGIAWIKWPENMNRIFSLPEFRRPARSSRTGAAFKHSASPSSPRETSEAEPLTEDFISKEVDPILDKISAHGIHSLTERERKILEQARSVMAKRS